MSDLDKGTQEDASLQVEGQQTEALPTSEEPTEAKEPTLPDGVKQRTAEEFEKLKTHNAELKAKLESYEGIQGKNSVLDEIRPRSVVEQPFVQTEEPQFIDKEGYVDTALIAKQLKEAKDIADKAQREAQLAKQQVQNFQETAEVHEAHTAFPELNPNDTEHFDRKFYDLVRNELIGQMVSGTKENLVAAAKKVKEELYNPSAPQLAKAEEVTKAKAAREQASVQPNTASGNSSPEDHENLVAGTYRGDVDAIYKRLIASGN